MNTRKHKSDIPEEVTNYCIDNKLTVAEGLIELIEKKFESVDQNLKSLKHDVTTDLYTESNPNNLKVTNDDIKDVEDFLDNFNDSNDNS